MISSIESLITLGHGSSNMLVAVMAVATAAGFIAGLFFDRATRRSQDDEK